jgi:hypothetical protein
MRLERRCKSGLATIPKIAFPLPPVTIQGPSFFVEPMGSTSQNLAR